MNWLLKILVPKDIRREVVELQEKIEEVRKNQIKEVRSNTKRLKFKINSGEIELVINN
jgi:hypothetical protein